MENYFASQRDHIFRNVEGKHYYYCHNYCHHGVRC